MAQMANRNRRRDAHSTEVGAVEM